MRIGNGSKVDVVAFDTLPVHLPFGLVLDMVRSMMSLTDLPLSFWGYALETAAFMLNRAQSKSVETTVGVKTGESRVGGPELRV